ncbi:DUF2946 family protein [Pseudorhodoferax sp.]|uniref:DUF2946 family protein n=1 Tax=Pseudorhodoferax sp. TaxID=1993553 RepID=UPI0039E25152
MDDIVHQAIAKWPNVPHCYGWLGLDARGDWYLRDAQAQAAGPFGSGRPGAKGDRLRHEGLLAFIGRNYECDARGCWFFQNGPQRVYVELEVTPWIWRVADDFLLTSHTGVGAALRECLLDEQGRVFLATDLGLGLVHTLDVDRVATAVEQAGWVLREVRAAELPARHGFVLSPQQLPRA